jgi:preprotein translocase subunit SecF
MIDFDVPDLEYEDYSNRQLIAIPLVALAIALLIVGGAWVVTGDPVPLGIDFAGGNQLRVGVTGGGGEAAIESTFDQPIEAIQFVPANGEYIVTFGPDADTEQLIQAAQNAEQLDYRGVSQISATFGAALQGTALQAVVLAFLGMSLVVFGMFRTFVPSIAVVISAFSDIMIPVALMNVFDIDLTLGTVAALLMIIGYSVDSDILLNTHVFKRSGDFYESTYRARRTGVTMTVTSLVAMTAMAVVAAAFGIQLLTSIGLILVFGLLTDLVNTYLLNVSLLRWYRFKGVKS